jgi:hypothetical protein
MKTIKIIVGNALDGIAVGMLGKVFLENVIGWGTTSAEQMLATQVIFIVVSAIGGLSFSWLYVEFRRGITQYLAIILTYFICSNLAYWFFIQLYHLKNYVEEFIFMNIFWLIICTLIYLIIITYYHLLAKQLNKELSKKDVENDL